MGDGQLLSLKEALTVARATGQTRFSGADHLFLEAMPLFRDINYPFRVSSGLEPSISVFHRNFSVLLLLPNVRVRVRVFFEW